MNDQQIAELQQIINSTIVGHFGNINVKIMPHRTERGNFLISINGRYIDQDNIQDCFRFLSAFFLKASVLTDNQIWPEDPDA